MKRDWLAQLALATVIAVCLAFAGCSGGSDGAQGPAGPPGQDGTDGTNGQDGQDGQDGLPATQVFTLKAEQPEVLIFTVTNITIASPPVVQFTVTDAAGRGAVDLGSYTTNGGTRLGWVRFSMAKLMPGALAEDPIDWWDYINGERVPANLQDNGDGTYQYRFAKDLGAYDVTTPITYDPSLRHRLAIQSSGGEWDAVNLVVDFVPNQLPGPAFTFPHSRDLVTTDACNECHGELTLHGSRYDTKYCVVCHNPTLDGGNGHMTTMVHGIHAAGMRTTEYELGGHLYGEVTYPQDLRNCRKCHKGTDSDNWKTKPSMEACGACHDDVDFSGAGAHIAQTSNQVCNLCHTPTYIETKHLTDNATPNNPSVPAGASNFTYEIQSVDSDAVIPEQPTVVFRILKDGTPVTFNTYAPGGTILLTGFTGSPSFLVAYALPQGPWDVPVDYNNRGKTAAQPASVSIANCWNGTQGTLSGPDASGWYTAKLNGSNNAGRWPAGAMLRAVALQGYFTQVSPAVARHTISVMKGHAADGDRRTVVDSAACARCHEWFEGHGGNRVYEVQVCVMCHVPNLSTSGRGTDPANLALPASTADDMYGLDPLTYPEDTNNFKDMIHGIHASAARTNHYEFVRDRGTSGIYGYDWSEVTFPGILNNCTTCHLNGTFEVEGMADHQHLPSNVRTTSGDPAEIRATILAARASVPNDTDLVNSPLASACYYCHDSAAAAAHMEYNGGRLGWDRLAYEAAPPYESCEVCHGEGKIADIHVLHEEASGE